MLLRASISQTSALAIRESRQGREPFGRHGLLAGPTSVRRVLSCLQTVGPDSSHAPAWEPCRGAPTRSMGAIKARTMPLEVLQALRPAFAARARLPRSSAVWHLGLCGSAALGAKLLALLAAIARICREGVLPKSLRQMLRGMDGARRYAPSSYESAR